MTEAKINISELKSEGSDIIKDLTEFLKEKTKAEVDGSYFLYLTACFEDASFKSFLYVKFTSALDRTTSNFFSDEPELLITVNPFTKLFLSRIIFSILLLNQKLTPTFLLIQTVILEYQQSRFQEDNLLFRIQHVE